MLEDRMLLELYSILHMNIHEDKYCHRLKRYKEYIDTRLEV
jgi:hypothetical protein